MSSIIKSISLDPQTAHLASKLPNFSRVVRECLIRHHLTEGGEWGLCKREDEDSKRCLPMVKPRCVKCWPAGPPDSASWTAYVRAPRTHDPYGKELSRYMQEPNPEYMDHELVQDRALKVNPAIFSFEDMILEGNAKPTKKAKRRSIIRRMLNLLHE